MLFLVGVYYSSMAQCSRGNSEGDCKSIRISPNKGNKEKQGLLSVVSVHQHIFRRRAFGMGFVVEEREASVS